MAKPREPIPEQYESWLNTYLSNKGINKNLYPDGISRSDWAKLKAAYRQKVLQDERSSAVMKVGRLREGFESDLRDLSDENSLIKVELEQYKLENDTLKGDLKKLQAINDNACEDNLLKWAGANGFRNNFIPSGQYFPDVKKIIRVTISGNKEKLPIDFWRMSQLVSLTLTNMEFVVLDDKGNRIDTCSVLPKEIANLQKLEYLDLSDNGLLELPDSIKDIRELKVLNLSGNPLPHLPLDIAKFINGIDNIDHETRCKVNEIIDAASCNSETFILPG